MSVAELDRSLENSIKRSFLAVWRHKFVFLITSATVFSAVIVGCLAIQPIYEGSTLLIGGQVNLEQLPDASRKPVQTSNSLSRIAESEEVVRQAIEKVGLTNLVDNVNVRSVSVFARLRAAVFPSTVEPQREVPQVEALLPQIKSKLKVRGEPSSDIIRIAYRHKDPVVATDFANAVAQAFVDRQIALYGRPGAAEFFMRQRQRFDEEFARASDALERFAISTATYSADDQRELLLKRMSDLASSLTLIRGSISEKVGQRQALAESLRKLAPVARSSYVSALVDTLSPDRAAAGSRIGESRALDDRSSDPPLLLVKVYQDSMVSLFKLNADLAGAQNMQRQQIEEMAKLTADLNGLSQNEQQFASLKRAVAQASFNSDLYAKRMVEEQINAESSAAKFSSVKVLQRATEPLRPAFPNYPLITLAGGMVSAGIGVGAALLRNHTRSRRQVHA